MTTPPSTSTPCALTLASPGRVVGAAGLCLVALGAVGLGAAIGVLPFDGPASVAAALGLLGAAVASGGVLTALGCCTLTIDPRRGLVRRTWGPGVPLRVAEARLAEHDGVLVERLPGDRADPDAWRISLVRRDGAEPFPLTTLRPERRARALAREVAGLVGLPTVERADVGPGPVPARGPVTASA